MQTTHDIVLEQQAAFAALVKSNGGPVFSSSENIAPKPCKGGINPSWQSPNVVDRALVARSNEVNHACAYRAQVGAMAQSVARKYVLRYGFDHLRQEFAGEAESAIGAAIALRIHRFPRLASDLLARFAIGALPSSSARAFRRVALRACDSRLRRMAHTEKNQSLDDLLERAVTPKPFQPARNGSDLAFFSLFTWAPPAEGSRAQDADAQETCNYVNARIDLLLRLVRERGVTSGNAARSATAHARLLEQAREVLLASARGESVSLPAHGLISDGERGKRLGKSALYFRVYRLGQFLGDGAILASLRYAAHR